MLTAVSLAGMWVWWFGHGGHRGQVIDIDNAAPLDYRFLVDLNRAEWPELAQLPGIGETLARRIIASRVVEGPFRSAEDLRRINGIGPRKLEAVRRYLLPMVDDTQVAGEKPPMNTDTRG